MTDRNANGSRFCNTIAGSFLPTRIEQVRDCIAKEADRLAAVLSEDSRIVVQLRVQVRELNEIARLQRKGE